MKPLIYQLRKKPVFCGADGLQTATTSSSVRSSCLVPKARCNGGYGFWQMAFGSDGTTE
ncbi:Mu-like prophage major head subunit gpT family protein [Escherichia coli]|uniref:Mu-like prophage major head subunit gpT family protein n=1 Tax=Escherichia coli TaxID=562 RepID=UPI003B27E6C7